MNLRMSLGCLLLVLLVGCDAAREPVRVGFIGGLSGRNSDNGQSGYNGVVLAVEQANRAGGINGRQIVLEPRDDAQSSDTATKSAQELVAAKVEAVIGPFTSSMAAVVMPVFEGAGILTISPTITGMDFHGKDDYLVRINRTTRDNARDYAKVLFARGQKRIGVALDLGNRVFTESWLKEFRASLEALGGTVIVEVPYESGDSTDFGTVMRGLLDKQPDGLLFLSGAIDVARLAQQARKQAPQLPISASEWAGTEQLLDLGGTVVEELLIVQNFNPDDRSSRYVAFREAYFRRFKRDPGYSSVMAYDAATVLLEALRRRSSGETLKQAIPQYGPYEGLQQQIVFDANGDTERKVFFTEIRKGKFQLLE